MPFFLVETSVGRSAVASPGSGRVTRDEVALRSRLMNSYGIAERHDVTLQPFRVCTRARDLPTHFCDVKITATRPRRCALLVVALANGLAQREPELSRNQMVADIARGVPHPRLRHHVAQVCHHSPNSDLRGERCARRNFEGLIELRDSQCCVSGS